MNGNISFRRFTILDEVEYADFYIKRIWYHKERIQQLHLLLNDIGLIDQHDYCLKDFFDQRVFKGQYRIQLLNEESKMAIKLMFE